MSAFVLSIDDLCTKLDTWRTQQGLTRPQILLPLHNQLRQAGPALITSITHDSRSILPGALYVALAGRVTHGARFLSSAIDRGAIAIALPTDTPADLLEPLIDLEDQAPPVIWLSPQYARLEMAWLSAWVTHVTFDATPTILSRGDAPSPSSSTLSLIGITGTNGKTTTSTLLASMLRYAEGDVGLIGTIETSGGGVKRTARMTTMEAPDLHTHYRALIDAGLRRCVMEVSSIGIEEDRVSACRYERAAFLNLSADHLDYHQDMACYAEAKLKLFRDLLTPNALSVIYLDDEDPFIDVARRAVTLAEHSGRTVWRCRLTRTSYSETDVYWQTLSLTPSGITGIISTPLGNIEVSSPLMGRFNAINIAVAVAIALSLEVDHASIIEALAHTLVPGRMERVLSEESEKLPNVLVDYAHTPDALQNAIHTLKDHCRGRLWVLFGCGGGRDRVKRPLMGRAAAHADGVVLTSDNPRDESPQTIIKDAQKGLLEAGLAEVFHQPEEGHFWIEEDRGKAIYSLIEAASPNDLILIAGKGHESYQESADGHRIPFSDQQYAYSALQGILHRDIERDAPDSWPLHSALLCADARGQLRSGHHRPLSGVAIDTRKITHDAAQRGVAFFCLVGSRDGHDFIPQAIRSGAEAIFVKAAWQPNEELKQLIEHSKVAIISVNHPEHALAQCAVAHRQRVFKGFLIGLTGSNGKTSTKDLLKSALSEFGPTLATAGNHNNHLGVPLTLLRLRPYHQFAVVEMGMNAPGEIAQLATWADPDLGLITTISTAHLEGLGSIEAIALAKGELVGAIAPRPTLIPSSVAPDLRSLVREQYPDGQLMILPAEPSFQLGPEEHVFHPSLFIHDVDLTLTGARAVLELETLSTSSIPLKLQLTGRHQLDNARLALAAAMIAISYRQTAHLLDQEVKHSVTLEEVEQLVQGLAQQEPANLRGQVLHYPLQDDSYGQLWLDCYNANPQSVLASLKTFVECGFDGVFVIGSIAELGPRADELHEHLGHEIAPLVSSQSHIMTVGVHGEALQKGLLAKGISLHQLSHFSVDELPLLADRIKRINPASIFVKGSRSLSLERLSSLLDAISD